MNKVFARKREMSTITELSRAHPEEIMIRLREAGFPEGQDIYENFLTYLLALDRSLLITGRDSYIVNSTDFVDRVFSGINNEQSLTENISRALSTVKLPSVFDQMLAEKRYATRLYVTADGEEYISSVRSNLAANGVEIIVDHEPQPGEERMEVFVLVIGGYDAAKAAVQRYGRFAVVIGVQDAIYRLNSPTATSIENITMTIYSPLQLERYLLTPYDVKDKQLTYSVSGYSGIIKYQLHILLRGWRLVYGKQTNLDFLYFDLMNAARRDKTIEKMSVGIKSVIDVDSVIECVNKRSLFFAMKTLYPEDYLTFITETVDIADFVADKPLEYPVILRPYGTGAYSGKGVFIVNSDIQFEAVQDKLINYPYIVSRYIGNPYLYDEKKFHLRVLFLVTSWGTVELYPKMQVYTARSKWIPGDYIDQEMHKTNYGNTSRDVFFPDDFPGGVVDRMRSQIEGIFSRIRGLLHGGVRSYPEAKFGFETIEADVMFDNQLNAWLIEINTQVGFGPVLTVKDVDNYTWANEIISWIYDRTISKYLAYRADYKMISVDDILTSTTDDIAYALSKILSNYEIMKNVTGETWPRSVLWERMNKERQELKDSQRKSFSWIIRRDENVVGFATMTPSPMFDPQLAVALLPGLQSGLEIIRMVVNAYWSAIGQNRKIYTLVPTTAQAQVSMFLTLRWIKLEDVKTENGLRYVFATSY